MGLQKRNMINVVQILQKLQYFLTSTRISATIRISNVLYSKLTLACHDSFGLFVPLFAGQEILVSLEPRDFSPKIMNIVKEENTYYIQKRKHGKESMKIAGMTYLSYRLTGQRILSVEPSKTVAMPPTLSLTTFW